VKIEETTTGLTTSHIDVYIDGKLIVSKDVDGTLDIRSYLLKDSQHSVRRDRQKYLFCEI